MKRLSRALQVLAFAASLISVNSALAKAADRVAVEKQFRGWIESEIWPAAQAEGISRGSFDHAFANVAINWKLPDLVMPGEKPKGPQKQSQAEFSSPGPYFNEKRLQSLATTGKAYAGQYKKLLAKIEKHYGVPGEIVLAIWGRETGYGKATITSSEIDVLATMAFLSERKDLFRKELLAALIMVEQGVDPSYMKGSWAGAMGQPQFMPSSYLKYAVDFDGDGKKDIWNSVPDALGSVANYLAAKGWQVHRSWGYEVTIPDSVSCAQEGPDLSKPIGKWTSSGIKRVSGENFSSSEQKAKGMMLVPAGRHGPQFIVTPNFYVIKEYNNSDLYALFIGNLADRIKYGASSFDGAWGTIGHMLRSDVLSMQNRLSKIGYDVGKIDGLPGYKTRRSIGQWQEKNDFKPTCYPDETLLKKIK